MKRWNGWGEQDRHYPLSAMALTYLAGRLGKGAPTPDADLPTVLATVPDSRLPTHPLITTAPLDRLLHARGQSLPDWIALRSGRIGLFPDGVAYPTSDDEVRELLRYVQAVDAALIPYGGGTSVAGHINPQPDDRPTLTVAMGRLNRLLDFDLISHLATFEAGVTGPDLERHLRRRGFTLGHYPQSFEYSTLGGWIATRSSGQQSYFFGRIEDHFAGGRVETPAGALELLPHPATAAGPDLRQAILGSEGRLGIITRAVVRVRPVPPQEQFFGVFFHDWASGMQAVRTLAQADAPVSMLRLSDAVETETNLRLASSSTHTSAALLLTWGERALRLARYGTGRCLLIWGATGDAAGVQQARQLVGRVVRAHGGLSVGSLVGRTWAKGRFFTPYLRNTLWEAGYAVDTFETAVTWERAPWATTQLTAAVADGLAAEGEKVLAMAHLSHIYRDGASIYVTYLFRRAADPEATLRRWQGLKHAASLAVVRCQGTISHQHGVGVDHAPYLAAEKGPLGLEMIGALLRQTDPEQRLNPGKLLDR